MLLNIRIGELRMSFTKVSQHMILKICHHLFLLGTDIAFGFLILFDTVLPEMFYKRSRNTNLKLNCHKTYPRGFQSFPETYSVCNHIIN